jgi:ubiquinone/menaquinone biosynthesis C-methylase UbiE
MDTAEELQRRYYADTADRYDEMHVHADDEHYVALRYISGLLNQLGAESVLDVGCGTGRGVQFLRAHNPGLRVIGVEPVQELLEQGVTNHRIPREAILQGSGERLPFDSQRFDAVCELGVLHHIADPGVVVSEMTRVARRAVFLSDGNMFGIGSVPSRLAKLALRKVRLWDVANRIRSRGRAYRLSVDDGVSYPYSVFESYRDLAEWADRVIMIPTVSVPSGSWLHPLLTTSHLLLAAIREPPDARAPSVEAT